MSCSIFESREAITSTYYRTLRAFDDNDLSLFNAAFAEGLEDIVYVFDEYETHGMDAIRERVFGFIGPMITTHLASNVVVDLDDDCNTASLSAVVVGQECLFTYVVCREGWKSHVGFLGVAWVCLYRMSVRQKKLLNYDSAIYPHKEATERHANTFIGTACPTGPRQRTSRPQV